jgi:DNA-binding MarR family transcriptional regulator
MDREFIHNLIDVKKWEKTHLPFTATEAGFQVYLHLLLFHGQQNVLKIICNSADYSEKTVRGIFRAMEADGWITIGNHVQDKRFVRIHLTQKLLDKTREWIAICHELSRNSDIPDINHPLVALQELDGAANSGGGTLGIWSDEPL